MKSPKFKRLGNFHAFSAKAAEQENKEHGQHSSKQNRSNTSKEESLIFTTQPEKNHEAVLYCCVQLHNIKLYENRTFLSILNFLLYRETCSHFLHAATIN